MDHKSMILSDPHFTESRLNSLYSNFNNLKVLNPEGFEANIQAWGSLLSHIPQHGYIKDSMISVPSQDPDLAQFLSVPLYGKPSSLGLILNELVSRRVLVPWSTYRDHPEPFVNADTTKLLDYISPQKWLQWSLGGLVGGFSSTSKDGALAKERYISWDLLTNTASECDKVIKAEIIQNGAYSGFLHNDTTLFELISTKLELSKIDFDAVLVYLSRDKHMCTIKEFEDIKYIRYSPKTEEISDNEIRVINLKSTIENLRRRKNYINQKIGDVESDMDSLLDSKDNEDRKTRLKHLLRTRAVLRKSLETCSVSYNELNTVLIKIDDSNMNINIHEQLLHSSKVLKELNSQINIDSVDELKWDIDEEIKKTDEISEALGGSEIDDEVEEEFAALEKKEAEKKDKNEKTKEDTKANKIETPSNASSSTIPTNNEKVLEDLKNLTIKSPEQGEESEKTPQLEPA